MVRNGNKSEPKTVSVDPFYDDSEVPAESLSPRQIECINLLVAGVPQLEIAQKLNITEGTICRWKKENPHFITAFNRLKKSNQEAVEAKLKSLSLTAVEAIQEILIDPNISPKLRAEQAWRILEFLNLSPADDRGLQDDLKSNFKEVFNKNKREKSAEEFDKLLDDLDFT